jgi:hypothetical protein
MATLTTKLDAAIDKLQDIHDEAIDEDLETQAERLEELIDELREIDFAESDDEEEPSSSK